MCDFDDGWRRGYHFPSSQKEEELARERGDEFMAGFVRGQKQRLQELECVSDDEIKVGATPTHHNAHMGGH